MQWTAAGEENFNMLLSKGICRPTPCYRAILQHIGTSQNEQAGTPDTNIMQACVHKRRMGIRPIDTKSYHRPEIGRLFFLSGILQGSVLWMCTTER